MTIQRSTTTLDQNTYIHAKLLQRSYLKLIAASICDSVPMEKGSGITAHFVRYKRMNVPVNPISEGVDPSSSSFSLEEVTVTLDQWGDTITLTDVAILTTRHPLLQTALELLSDNAQRVVDREVQIVLLSGTNVMYGDGSVTTRSGVTAGMTVSDTLIHKARIQMANNGAPPREGPGNMKEKAQKGALAGTLTGGKAYVAVCSTEISADIMSKAATSGLWAAVAQYQNKMAVYNAEVGTYLGIRWVESNFLPKFEILGNTTAAVASGASFGTDTPTVTSAAGGALAAVPTYFKVTRKDLQRGFEEDISIIHSITPTATHQLVFNFAAVSAGYVYNIYAGTVNADASLFQVAENVEAGSSVSMTAVPTSGDTAPANVNTVGTPDIHPVYIIGADAVNWVGLQNMETMVTKDEATTDNPLKLRRKIGYKFMAKAMIKDQARILRLELPSNF